MRPRPRAVCLVLPFAALALALTLGAPGRAADPLSVADIVRLLEAGVRAPVILRQIEATGSRFDLEVEDILRLKQAGAGDDLLGALIGAGPEAPETGVEARGTRTASQERVRVFRTRTSEGEAIVLTNLDEEGRPLGGGVQVDRREGISPEKASSPSVVADATGASPVLLPSRIEITVREEPSEERSDDILQRIADRLDHLEQAASQIPEPESLPVGAEFPHHPINDFRESPVLGAWPWGAAVLVPVGFAPQPFRVNRFGPFLSVTEAFAAGVDPFKPVPPCQPGQACGVLQRLQSP